jgi:hypothetical protein
MEGTVRKKEKSNMLRYSHIQQRRGLAYGMFGDLSAKKKQKAKRAAQAALNLNATAFSPQSAARRPSTIPRHETYPQIVHEPFEIRTFRRRTATATGFSLIIHLMLSLLLFNLIVPEYPPEVPPPIGIEVDIVEIELPSPKMPMPFIQPPPPEAAPETPAPEMAQQSAPPMSAPPADSAPTLQDEVPPIDAPDLPPVNVPVQTDPRHIPNIGEFIANPANRPSAAPSLAPPEVEVDTEVSTFAQVPETAQPTLSKPMPTPPVNDLPERPVSAGAQFIGEPIKPRPESGTASGRRNRPSPSQELVEKARETQTSEVTSDFGTGVGTDAPRLPGNGGGKTGGDGTGDGDSPADILGRSDFAELLKKGNDAQRGRDREGKLNVIFLLDQSSSMGDGNKFELAKSALKDAILDLEETDQFHLVLFDSHIHLYKRTYQYATQPNKQTASTYLDAQSIGTGTNIYAGLQNALRQQPAAAIVWLISDGMPSEGIQNPMKILRKVRVENRRAVIHTIGLGQGKNFEGSALLSKLARQNHGVFRGIDITRY